MAAAQAIRDMENGATELNLGLNRIGAEGSKTLGEALKQNETLQTLKLWGNNIGDEGGKALGEALKQNKTLLELDLGNNNIGAEGGKALGEALKQNETLQALFLGLNRIGAEGGKALGEALKQNKTLQALFLYNNDIGAEGGKALGEALKQNETLLELDLGKNNIGAEGGKALGEALKQNETLLELRLGDNNIGAEGGKALGEALKQNKTLQSLDLRWNNIGAEGAKALGEALKQNKTLQWLNLDGNNIGDEGAKALGEALKQNKTLQWLNLHNNDIGDEGGKALGEALKQNKTLQTLALLIKGIGAEGGKALGEALKQNKTLQWLNLEDNDIDGSTFREIEAALARNRANPPQRHDDAWMEAIKAAINEGDEHAWGRAKLMVVGRGAAGKTSTVRSLLGQTPVMEHNSTEVADLLRTNAQHWQALSSDHGEFDAQARYAALRRLQEAPERKSLKRKSLARRASEAAQSLVSAATGGRLSASKSPARLEAAAASAPAVSMPSAHKALVDEEELTRKFALRDEDQAVLQGAAQAEARDVSFTIWDYGGQKVFYALHHIFLTDKGLYLVVFDMREIVGKEHFRDLLTLEEYQKLSTQAEAIAFLRFWLHSIRLHAPEAPVLMIGTFLDQVTQLREVNRVLREQVSATLHKHLVKPPKRGDLFFAIDNSSNDKDRAAELRTAIASVASEQRYVREQVPLAWLKLHEDMLQSCEPYMLYDEVVERAAEYGRPRTDVDAMLAYFHGLGVVVHLRGSQTLEHVVVIDAEWLLKKLARVIADDLHAQPLFSDPDLESAGLLPAYERLRKDMIATRSLLEWLWADQEVDYLLQFMEANMLLCPWRFDEHRDEDEFLVSGLLSDSIQQVETRKFKRGLTCELDFSSFFLPNGVFHRLVAQCATYATQRDAATSRSLAPRPPKLDAQTAKVFFGRDSFLMEVRGDAIQITVSATAKRPARVIKLLVSMFREQAETVFCGLEWRLLLHSPTTGARVSYHELTRARDNGSEELWAVDEEDDVADVADFDPFFVEQIGALDTDEDGADVARVPGVPSLGPNEDTHVFLSHVQSTGGDLAGILRLKLENRGLDVWFDQSYRDNLNQQAMLDGVRRTHTYVLVLTKGIFESSAVLEELRCARDSEKHIVVVHEADTHRASYASFGEYIASTPDFCDGFFLEEESLPVRRKWYEEEAFYNELVRRCFEQ